MAGIYIHVPFCKQACSYCDFHFSTTFESYRKQLIDTMCQEIQIRKNEIDGLKIKTIYFGGGTPSLLNETELDLIFNFLRKHYSIDEKAEITLECNPDDVDIEKLKLWSKIGVNRLSIGVQSFNDEDLKWMNRAHNSKMANDSLKNINEFGFLTTLDLIYGLPNASTEEWEGNILKALKFKPDHISAYCLTVEPKTLLHHQVQKSKINIPSEDEQNAQFELLIELLKRNGYSQYEISNFARNNKYALHNSNYWLGEPYLGIGPSAHSFDGKFKRKWNVSNNTKYIKSINKSETYWEEENLNVSERANEIILTRLRTVWGIDLEEISSLIKLTDEFTKKIQSFIEQGFIYTKNNHIYLTDLGKNFADRIASELFFD